MIWLLALGWVCCSILSYQIVKKKLVEEYPTLPWTTEDIILTSLPCIGGPVSLFAAIVFYFLL